MYSAGAATLFSVCLLWLGTVLDDDHDMLMGLSMHQRQCKPCSFLQSMAQITCTGTVGGQEVFSLESRVPFNILRLGIGPTINAGIVLTLWSCLPPLPGYAHFKKLRQQGQEVCMPSARCTCQCEGGGSCTVKPC